MEQEPSQVAVKGFGIPAAGKVAIFKAPVGNGAADAVNDLPHRLFPLGSVRLAEKILAGNDIDGELTPSAWESAVMLLKNGGSAVPFDGSGTGSPFDGIEGIADMFGAECRFHFDPFGRRGVERIGVYGGGNVQTGNSGHLLRRCWEAKATFGRRSESIPCQICHFTSCERLYLVARLRQGYDM